MTDRQLLALLYLKSDFFFTKKNALESNFSDKKDFADSGGHKAHVIKLCSNITKCYDLGHKPCGHFLDIFDPFPPFVDHFTK